MAWTEADDDRIRKFMETADRTTMTACPKCNLGAGGGSELVLGMVGCTHKYCPLREYRDRAIPKPSMLPAMSRDMQAMKDKIDSRLNAYLCDMKPNYDDSITGFNEAWDIVRKAFVE